MERTKEIINNAHKDDLKLYYRLNELEEITGLCARSLKYRMKKIKVKYEGIHNLLHKTGRQWNIHYTIVNEFMPKYKRNESNLYNHDWKYITTWNLLNDYSLDYHQALIEEIKNNLVYDNLYYVIEEDSRGYYHTHMLTDNLDITDTVKSVLNKYLSYFEYRLECQEVINKYSAVIYLNKAKIKHEIL